ncbi:MAG: hypothetical protein Q4D44_07025 [Eubacteriales bacterium]|nr:hypothetical protein [Eubacteriales bacterium]
MENEKKISVTKNKKFIYILCIVLALLLVFASVFATGYLLNLDGNDNITPTGTTATADEVTTTPVVTTPDETSPEEVKVPKVLSQLLERGGYTTGDLDFEQLIVVDSIGTDARIMFFEKKDNEWKFAHRMSTVTGYVGENGVADQVSEGELKTPAGIFSLGIGFGIMDDPGTKLDYIKVTEQSYWIDDPESAYYNQLVEGTENKDWNSAEQISLYSPEYNYAVFIEYNTDPVVKGAGSAFFLREGRGVTRGSVAIPHDSMIDALCWLDKDLSPHIMILKSVENN